jgi:hypothetical protein
MMYRVWVAGTSVWSAPIYPMMMGVLSGNSSTTPGPRIEAGMSIDHRGHVWLGWGTLISHDDNLAPTQQVADLWYASRLLLPPAFA